MTRTPLMTRREFLKTSGLMTLGASASAAHAQGPAPLSLPLLVGTYTAGDAGGKGIYHARMDPRTGALELAGVTREVENPSFLALHPSGRLLFAVNETAEHAGRPTGAVSAFRLSGGSDRLSLLGRQASEGTSPCHLTVDRSGRFVLVANYGSGTAAVLPIREDGRLGPAVSVVRHAGSGADPRRQEGPHAHSVTLDPANRFAVVADLGIDRLQVYRFDAEGGGLTPAAEPEVRMRPGAGPRHFAFHPGGRLAFVVNELDSTLSALAYDPERGSLRELQTVSTLPEGYSGPRSAADLHLSADGRFAYASNRGHDSIAVFAVDDATGRVRPVQHPSTGGRWPRNFALAPGGRFVLAANQHSGAVTSLARDPETGRLTPTGHELRVPSPVCVLFVPA